METEQNTDYYCILAILSCFTLSVIYVSSLYMWKRPFDRDHENTIKKRFLSAFIMMFVSPLFLYLTVDKTLLQRATIWELLGIRFVGLIQAIVLPLILTMVLFLGPLSVQVLNGFWRLYAEPMYWLGNMKSLGWWRNHIVAPLSEEWTFRACMLPMLLQCYEPTTAIFICPLFFGVAHFHHVIEMTRSGAKFKDALTFCSFQFAYTTLFGAYAAFLFAKTGHYIAPFTAHAFCNHMGFPDIPEVLACKDPVKKTILISLFCAGVIGWIFLLTPMTNPAWFSNKLFWQKHSL